MSEETTKGLTSKRLSKLGYPTEQDTKIEGVIWYKEDSYKLHDAYITECFSKSSKQLTGKEGTPDFTITSDNEEIIIVIECKKDTSKHQTFDNLEQYKYGIGTKEDINEYCINGALHYATYANNNHDVVAIAISGVKEKDIRVTSFVLPKGGTLEDIKLLEDGDYSNSIMDFEDYKEEIDAKLGRNQEESNSIMNELKSYASACNKYLRANHISAKDRAGFISAIVLALTNEESTLYTLTEASMPDTIKKRSFKDKIGENAITYLNESLRTIWIRKDKIPEIKRRSLEDYYNRMLTTTLLDKPENNPKYFKYGENVLSSCIFSVYENIVLKMKDHTNIDIMGTFYTVFLKYAKGDTRDKGIVLTPKHIAELFCDIAEHYLNKKLDESIKVLDCCCGTGAFLIEALHRMDMNIESKTVSEKNRKKKKKQVRESCLIGVEREPEMFALAYANMRFHGDGKSKLYACSSLLKDKGIATFDTKGEPVYLKEEIKLKEKPKVGMINPPYSLLSTNNKSKKNKDEQSGQTELDFVYSMLEYLDYEGIGIAIVPMNCASSKNDKKLRKAILANNTLLAVMTMPSKLFKNSDVDVMSCIMVFRAGIPHDQSDKIVFLSRWIDDGFVTVPHSGRFDKNSSWLSIKKEWIRQLKSIAKSNDSIFMKREINSDDEWLAEAYVETDYSKITEKDFENQLKKYALYKYMQECCEEA